MKPMVKIYVRSIIAGKLTVNGDPGVPEYWKADVIAVFDEKLENGEITQDQYDQYMGNTDK